MSKKSDIKQQVASTNVSSGDIIVGSALIYTDVSELSPSSGAGGGGAGGGGGGCASIQNGSDSSLLITLLMLSIIYLFGKYKLCVKNKRYKKNA